MELLFERNKVFIFSMEIDPSATVLEMKQKIEKTYGISVSNQTIFFKGKILHSNQDSHTLEQCKIVKKSRLELYYSRSRHISEVRQRREQSRAPLSTSVKDVIVIEDSPEKNQDSSNVDQTEKSLVPSYTFEEIFGTQAATEGNVDVQEPSWSNENRQDWLQRESYSTPNTFEAEAFVNLGNVSVQEPSWRNENSQDWFQRESYSTPNTFEAEAFVNPGNVSVQEPSWRNENHQDWFQRETSSTSNIFGDLLFGDQDYPLTKEHFANIQNFGYPSTTQEQRINEPDLPVTVSQVVPTEKTPRFREVIDIPDSPEGNSKKRPKKLLRVMVLSFPTNDTPARKFPVEVNPSDNVEVLRIELAKMQQRSQLLLPEEGYFFIHKTRMLNEKQSFRWNRVDQGDTIEIFPGTVSDDHRTNTRT